MDDAACTLRAGRLLRTVRHLTPRQILWRARNIVHAATGRLLPRRMPARLRRSAPRWGAVDWIGAPLRALCELRAARPLPYPGPPDEILGRRFRLAGETYDFGETVDWHRADLRTGRPLAGFELHYQHYLETLAAARAETGEGRFAGAWAHLTASWIASVPPHPRERRFGWSPYVISERLRVWLASGGRLRDAVPPDALPQLERSLAEQTAFLAANLEWDLQANHLWQNLCGLLVAAACMDGPAARGVRRRRLPTLARVVREQVLADGMHEERSFAYHVKCMRDLAEVLAVAEAGAFDDDPGAPACLETLRHAAGAMAGIVAGTLETVRALPLMNDGEEVPPDEAHQSVAEIARFAEIGRPTADERLRGSGYLAAAVGPWSAVFDVGPPGPGHQLGHAHADHLGFELWHRGRKLACDGGNVTYNPGEQRQRDRGTAAHNTVRLDGQDSMETWSSFRVGRRPRRCRGRILRQDADGICWEGEHDGYAHRPGRPVHRRTFTLEPWGLAVLDRVEGSGTHGVESFLHLAPDAVLEPSEDAPALPPGPLPDALRDGVRRAWRWRLPDGSAGRIIALWPAAADLSTGDEPSSCAPRQNHELPSRALRLSGAALLPFAAAWLLLDADAPAR
ncbi:MAG: hypothetical protein GXY85_09060 [Candidatus Brocadiaceae bacterium]|nr:hypothetical protein [Candidatus Brocadiaceae bacterium]